MCFLQDGWLLIISTNHLRVRFFLNIISMEELIVLTKSMLRSFYLYLFLIFSISSVSVFAGVDPDEANFEDEVQIQDQVKKEVIMNEPVQKITEQIVVITDSCISFPEAIAHKEHFACHVDIEKNILIRQKWSFAQLMVFD